MANSAAIPSFELDAAYDPPPLRGNAADDTYQWELSALPPQAHLSAGVELVVQGLDRTSPYSAVQHLQRLLDDLRKRTRLPDLGVMQPMREAGPSHSLNYAVVTFQGDYKANPHPDYMSAVGELIRGADEGISVGWNVAPGYDKLRTAWFRDDHSIGIGELKRGLEGILKSHHYDYQACTVNAATSPPRVTFQFIKKENIDLLMRQPPVVKGHTFIPRIPRYVEPIYALEVAVVGVATYNDPQMIIDRYLQAKYGRQAKTALIRSSRLVLEDVVYCVVLETPELTDKFVRDPFTAFEGLVVQPSKPEYLFILNQRGFPTQWQRTAGPSSSPDLHTQTQLDSIRTEQTSLRDTLTTLASQQNDMFHSFLSAQREIGTMFGNMISNVSFQTQLSSAQAEHTALRLTHTATHMMARLSNSKEFATEMRDYVGNVRDEMQASEQRVTVARCNLAALQVQNNPALLPAATVAQGGVSAGAPDQPPDGSRPVAQAPALAPPGPSPSAQDQPMMPPTPPGLTLPHAQAPPEPRAPPVPSAAASATGPMQGTSKRKLGDKVPKKTNSSDGGTKRTRVRHGERESMDVDDEQSGRSQVPFLRIFNLPPFHPSLGLGHVLNPGLKTFHLFLGWGPPLSLPPSVSRFPYMLLPFLLPILACLLSTFFMSYICICTLSYAIHFFSRERGPSSSLLLMFLFFYLLSPALAVTPLHGAPPSNFRMLFANMNGFANPIKMSAIRGTIMREAPHVFVLGETKSSSPVSGEFSVPDYQLFDAPGISTGARHKGKWGLVVGVKRSSLTVTRSFVPPHLQGRALVCDLLMPDSQGHVVQHRVIALYAPWDPRGNEADTPAVFWNAVVELCLEAPFGFSLIGDFNTVYNAEESSSSLPTSPSLVNQAVYSSFLYRSSAVDVWGLRPDRSWQRDWTFKSFSATPSHYAILDRLAVSGVGVLTAFVQTLSDFLPGTDHRPILGHIVLDAYYAQYEEHRLVFSSEHFLNFLRRLRRQLNQCRYHEEKQETQLRSDHRHMGRVQGLLHGGSAKSFFPPSFSPLPLALSSNADDSLDDLVTGPQRIRDTTVQYFQHLYRRSVRPPQQKPWTETPSVHRIAQRVDTEPFRWPHPLSIAELRQLLKSGNRRPAPGPDGWEKWWLAHLSDAGLSPVLQLLNYIITRSRIPACIKPVTLTTIHKRGPNTNLSNFRGITCSNLLANLPFAWLNKKLLPYLSAHEIVPSSQIATQPGVQHRDLLSFLAQVQMWARREQIPLFAIQRDQKKGFDMLEPEGFYDALAAYHLPSSIALLDASAQREVPYQVKTAYGLTDTFIVDGVTKQGGSISPLKCTITTSLLSHWLSDVSSHLERPLVVSSHQNRTGKPHVPSDSVTVPLSMVEAMDDSIIWDTDWPVLIHKARLADRFQSTYGWRRPGGSLLVPSVPPSDPSSSDTIWNDVPVYRDHVRFLRVPVNRPDLQFLHMRDVVNNFHLPFTRCPLPLTVLSRIISQRLVSKLRPCLQLQPIRPSDAVKLDHLIAAKVHQYLGFPFAFSTALFNHPVSSHGFGFPSLALLNDAACITGLQRDLCHPVDLYRNMATVTLNDWTCLLNACHSPLQYPLSPRSSTRYLSRMPATWIYANDSLHTHGLKLHPTDLSYLLSPDLSLIHYANVLDTYLSFPSAPPFPSVSRHLLSRMLRRGFTTIGHLGTVSISSDYYTPIFRLITPPTVRDAPPASSLSDWHAFLSWFTYTFLSVTTTSPAGPDLLLPPPIRREAAERILLSMSSTSPHLTCHDLPERAYASDASFIPPTTHTIPPTIQFTKPPSSLTCSVIGPDSGLLASVASPRYIASTSHAEVAGCLSAVLRAQHQSGGTIYTDYLPVVNWLSSRSAAPSAFHRWLGDITRRSPDTVVLHVKAHTTSLSLPARLNRAADHAASQCHSLYNPPPMFPTPTFYLPPYCLFAPGSGFLEGSFPQHLQKQQAVAFNTSNPVWSSHLTSPSLYDSTPPPVFPYQRTPYAYAAVIQLYARCAQLDSRDVLTSRLDAGCTPWCRFGCDVLESPHHIFTHCYHFNSLRQSAVQDLLSSLATTLGDSVSVALRHRLIALTSSLFSDCATWPTGQTRYYMGFLPSLGHLGLSPSLHTRVSHLWHIASIHLAGRIWAKARQRAFESRMSKPPRPPYHIPEIIQSLFHL
ncbi:hypothetical protein D9615_004273 [Tricholomella constricta]|uniref:Endonuclease/exonuclease/phosphatase domain-containing protein n=1 Tax=Tricholomella constricta TaxID=117010 RepID=A0A8H5HF45_9AGAR|nr:hypothetical protein D9615_004273 [Tricholomella constricta]